MTVGEDPRLDPEEEERKRAARSNVSTVVHSGGRLSEFSDSDLAWAFDDEHTEQLAQLRTIEASRSAPTRDPRWRELNRETERVVREWDAQEKAERYARARVEAMQRLGLSEAGTATR